VFDPARAVLHKPQGSKRCPALTLNEATALVQAHVVGALGLGHLENVKTD